MLKLYNISKCLPHQQQNSTAAKKSLFDVNQTRIQKYLSLYLTCFAVCMFDSSPIFGDD